MPQFPVQQWTVTEAEAGQKLFNFLKRRLRRGVPTSLVMRWMRSGELRVDGKRATPYQRLKVGQVLRIPPFAVDEELPDEAAVVESATLDLPVLFENEELLVIDKPAGLPVQPGTGHGDAVSTRLAKAYAHAPFVPAAAHRIDRDTAGIVMVGKTYHGLARLLEAFETRAIHKTYLAWVRGRWPFAEETVLSDRLEKLWEGNSQRIHAGRGKEALATAEPVKIRPDASLLLLTLHTGRTHQLRVQLSSRKHAIVGDRKYGDRAPAPGLLLHAHAVAWEGREFVSVPVWPGPWDVRSMLGLQQPPPDEAPPA
ncbi:RluA family pseudouridine synthase [Megalodesulfovibrio gigas]|uniref:Putative pseudouridine synthase, RluA family n=1 Tax=Megalodesulfovibrio gigas (strain ATCC 19364 / DSM 1382 / NCIMB 9332 / VKM B-1759) TaxID=1121448 RepID=T2G9E3_MEGG1|nr:RluA family pseudouridine synthase [Megalodesulfovibrio gigas]AGW12908.1 putative pseudouridine synthase, RluA family [Megalodesulfovibrio gigas DSM 1382 = ATCC 19364]